MCLQARHHAVRRGQLHRPQLAPRGGVGAVRRPRLRLRLQLRRLVLEGVLAARGGGEAAGGLAEAGAEALGEAGLCV